MIKEPYISVVSAVYQAEKIIPELILRLEKELSKINPLYEIISIEDCSKDISCEEINWFENNKAII